MAVVLLNGLRLTPAVLSVVLGDRLFTRSGQGCGMGVNVRVLGPLEIEAAGRCLVRLGPQQQQVFLILLLQGVRWCPGPGWQS